jgi:hypothetical protein
MDAAVACLETIEDAIGRSSSPLARALQALGEANRGRGTCLLLEHEEFGEALIADRLWKLGRDETLRNGDHFALVDLRQEHGFKRLAVLVQPSGDERELDEDGCALALAALEVTSALAEISGSQALEAPAMPARALGETMRDDGVWGN